MGSASKLLAKVNCNRKLFLNNWSSVMMSINVYYQTNMHRSDAKLKGNWAIKIALHMFESDKAN